MFTFFRPSNVLDNILNTKKNVLNNKKILFKTLKNDKQNKYILH